MRTREEHSTARNRPQDIFFTVNGETIVPIYDPPHLIKGIRNNLIKKKLVWEKQSLKVIAKWSDIKTAFEVDNVSGELRAMPKLTEGHINERKIKVSYATQVLSYTVASAIAVFARSGTPASDGTCLEERAKDTAQIIHFWDKVFDSYNGSTSGETFKMQRVPKLPPFGILARG